MAKIDLATTSGTAKPKRWVEVPEKDIYEFPFPTIRINLDAYGPGRHYVTSDVADEIEDRVRARMKHDLRCMQRNPDIITLDTMTRFGAARGTFSKNPDQEMAG